MRKGNEKLRNWWKMTKWGNIFLKENICFSQKKAKINANDWSGYWSFSLPPSLSWDENKKDIKIPPPTHFAEQVKKRMIFDAKKIKEARVIQMEEGKFSNRVAKTNKISFYCYLLSLSYKILSHSLLAMEKKISMKKTPLPFVGKSTQHWEKASDASIFYFSSRAGDGFCFLYPSIHPKILFQLDSLFCWKCFHINWKRAKEILVKMSFIFLSFSCFSQVRNYYFFGGRDEMTQLVIFWRHFEIYLDF